MPARKKSRFQIGKPDKAEIIVLSLPLLVLAVLAAYLLVASKPAPASTTASSPQSAALATPVVPTPTSIATPAAITTVPATVAPTAATTASSVTTAPAISPATTAPAPVRTIVPGSPAGTGIRLSKSAGGLKFDILVSPGHIGDNTYDLVLSENGKQAVSDASLVRLSVTSLDMDMGVARLDLTPAGPDQPGLYTGQDHKLQMLSMFGKFKIEVLVQRPAHGDVTTFFEVSVTSS